MTTMDHAHYETGRAGFGLAGSAGRLLRLAYYAMKMRSERAALQAMPDHMLKDMGISRSQIDRYTTAQGALTQADRMFG
ncbi:MULTISPECIES: DUF1127 domain-containing protein [unclassified Mesorhizobium]|uniref:DUF1127 domain-containing protein n=1 Tax=unclassified Mesorhizobium TaxID=325217 RepID=UPI0013ECDD27|nr:MULTISPECIES: DUF1127 domain-containing protein [unclassified Mesorhizobium]